VLRSGIFSCVTRPHPAAAEIRERISTNKVILAWKMLGWEAAFWSSQKANKIQSDRCTIGLVTLPGHCNQILSTECKRRTAQELQSHSDKL
jgi:hypothetical protein